MSMHLQKTHSKSYFMWSSIGSKLGEQLLGCEPYRTKRVNFERVDTIPVVVLQVAMVDSSVFVAEVVDTCDYESRLARQRLEARKLP